MLVSRVRQIAKCLVFLGLAGGVSFSSLANTEKIDQIARVGIESNWTEIVLTQTTLSSNCATFPPKQDNPSQSSGNALSSPTSANTVSYARESPTATGPDSQWPKNRGHFEHELIFPLLAAVIGAVLGSLCTFWLTSNHERNVSRNVARAVVVSLQREVEAGLEIIENVKSGVVPGNVGLLPSKGWEAMQSLLSDRDILDAIIRYGKKGQVRDSRIGTQYGGKEFCAFEVEEMLSHVKNYFCYIIRNFVSIHASSFSNPNTVAEIYVGAHNVNLTLKKILDGLSR